MRVTLSVDREGRSATTVASGPVTMEDIREYLAQARRGGRLAYREFIDASNARSVPTPSAARAAVDRLKTLARSGTLGRAGMIAPSEVSHGLARRVEILLEEVAEVRPFRTNEIAHAREWLEKN